MREALIALKRRRFREKELPSEAAEGHGGNGDCCELGGDSVVAFEDFADVVGGYSSFAADAPEVTANFDDRGRHGSENVARIENEGNAIAELAENFFATFAGGRAGEIGASAGERDTEFGDEIVDDFVPGPAEGDATRVAGDFKRQTVGRVDDNGKRTRPAGLRKTVKIVGKTFGEDLGVDKRVNENGQGAVFRAPFDTKNFFN